MNGRDRSAQRWREIVTTSARGDVISSEEAHYRAAYEVAHPDEAATELPLWNALGELGDDELQAEQRDDELVASALAMLDAPDRVPELPTDIRQDDRPRGRLTVILVGAGAVAAAAAAVLTLVRPGVLDVRSPEVSQPMAPSISEHADELRSAIERGAEPRTHGTTVRPETDIEPEPVPVPVPEEEAEPEIIEDEPKPTDTRRSNPPASTASADALLAAAQEKLGQGRTKEAMRSYRSLLAHHPGSAEAQTALVSMGRIELGRGRAAKALRYFDRYLGRSAGALREEARYGRIRCLRALRRSQQERASIEAFLADHPRSLYAPRLQRRIEELRADAP